MTALPSALRLTWMCCKRTDWMRCEHAAIRLLELQTERAMWIVITILFCIIFAVTWLVAGYSFIVGTDLTVVQYIAASFFVMFVGGAIAVFPSRRKRK